MNRDVTPGEFSHFFVNVPTKPKHNRVDENGQIPTEAIEKIFGDTLVVSL